MLPATNGLFVQVLPPSYRARAFGVIQSGLYLLQGAAVTVTGWLASHTRCRGRRAIGPSAGWC